MKGESLFPEAFLRKIERLELLARRAEGSGAPRADRKGGRAEFADHRRYAPGDELRYVDWHLYGRLGRLFLKEFAREETTEVVAVLDTSASMAGKLRGALRFTAALLVVAIARGDRVRVGLASGGDLSLSPALSGAGRRRDLLDRLASAESRCGGGTDLDRSLAAIPGGRGPSGRGSGRRLNLLVSDLLTEADGRRVLARLPGDTTVFHWVLPEELRPRPWGRTRLLDAEGGETLAFVDAKACDAYERAMERHMEELRSFFGRRGVRYLHTPADRPVEELVFGLLVREGVLG